MFQPVFNRARDRYEVHSGVTLAASASRMLLAIEAHPWLLPAAAVAIANLPGPVAVPFALLCMEANKVMPTDIASELGHEIRDAHIAQLEREIPIGPHQRRQYRVLSLLYPGHRLCGTQYLGQTSVCIDRDGDGIDVHFHREADAICGWTEFLTAMFLEIRDCPAGTHDLLWDLPGALGWRVAMTMFQPTDHPHARESLFRTVEKAGANRCRESQGAVLSLQCRYVRAHAPHFPVNNN